MHGCSVIASGKESLFTFICASSCDKPEHWWGPDHWCGRLALKYKKVQSDNVFHSVDLILSGISGVCSGSSTSHGPSLATNESSGGSVTESQRPILTFDFSTHASYGHSFVKALSYIFSRLAFVNRCQTMGITDCVVDAWKPPPKMQTYCIGWSWDRGSGHRPKLKETT